MLVRNKIETIFSVIAVSAAPAILYKEDMTDMCSVKINSIKGKSHILSIRKNGGVVAFLGSAVSIWHPSKLPAGQKVSESLSEVLASSTISPVVKIRRLIKRSMNPAAVFKR